MMNGVILQMSSSALFLEGHRFELHGVPVFDHAISGRLYVYADEAASLSDYLRKASRDKRRRLVYRSRCLLLLDAAERRMLRRYKSWRSFVDSELLRVGGIDL